MFAPIRYPASRVPIECRSPSGEPETFNAYVLGSESEGDDRGARGLRPNGELQRPAIHVGAFSGSDYDVLVIHNDDPWSPHRAAVTLVDTQRQNVLDLETLQRVPLTRSAGGATFSVSFEPGDGRLYLAGDDEAVDAARNAVLRRRYEHQALMLRLDAELAQRGGVNIAAVDVLLKCAAGALGDDPATALDLLKNTSSVLRKAEDATQNYRTVRICLETARDNFDHIYDWLNSAPFYPQHSDSSPSLRQLEERVVALSRSFSAVENAFRAGKLDVRAAGVLRRQTTKLRSDVLGYRPQDLAKGSIAVVELSSGDVKAPDLEARALAKRLRWMFTDVVHLSTLPDGRIVDADGKQADLAKYNLVWVHVGGRSSAAQARYCVSARLALGIPRPATVAALGKFSDGGGGLVLSGLGTCLAPNLGLEAYGPNLGYWGSMVTPGQGPSRHSPAPRLIKSLGLKPMVKDHPLFAGLPAGGFETMPFNASELVTEAVWQRPPGQAQSWGRPFWPEKGRVLAGYWADGVNIPPNYAAVVEYQTGNGGKAILLGGAFDPRNSTNQPRRGKHYDQLIRNVVDYCSRPIAP